MNEDLVSSKFFNREATLTGRTDALSGRGNKNPYPRGSAEWWVYEIAYYDVAKNHRNRTDDEKE